MLPPEFNIYINVSIHDKAKSTGVSLVIDSHNNLGHFTRHWKKLMHWILSGKERKVADIDSSGDCECGIVILNIFVVFAIKVGIFWFKDIV